MFNLRKIGLTAMVNTRNMAGHSKWANIKHIKEAKDNERAKIHSRITRLIRITIREGGSADPFINKALQNAIDQAKYHNIPNDKVQQILKAGVQKDDSKPGILEVRGPGGSLLVCDILTNNITRTRGNLISILKKHNASWADGIAKHAFNFKGVIRVGPLTKDQNLESALEHAIDAGAEDVKSDDGIFTFLTEPTEFYAVKTNLVNMGYSVTESNLEFLPVSRVSLSENDLQLVSGLHQKIDENPDVIKIYDNIE